MIIGICGTISCGKSTLVKHAPEKFYKFNLDLEIKKIHELKKAEIFKLCGTNNKQKIFELILKDSVLEKKLQKILLKNILDTINELKKQHQFVLFEAANIYQLNLNQYMDKIIFVNTSIANCLKFNVVKNKYEQQFVQKIIHKQIKENNFLNNADIIFTTSEDLENNITKFNQLLNEISN